MRVRPFSFAGQGNAKGGLEARTTGTGLMGYRAAMLDDSAPPKSVVREDL
jgi:hypothetical protein